MQGLNELSFKALRLFVAVLDYGSFSEVARREGLAPSSISRQIQLMEQALGQQLLYRHTRAVSPTEAGRLLGRHARLMLEQLEAAGQALQEQESEPSGLVRINAPMVFGQRHLSPWLGSCAGVIRSCNWISSKLTPMSTRCRTVQTCCFALAC